MIRVMIRVAMTIWVLSGDRRVSAWILCRSFVQKNDRAEKTRLGLQVSGNASQSACYVVGLSEAKSIARALAPPGRLPNEPCAVCGRSWSQGKHYVRAPAGMPCPAPGGCKAKLFERCYAADGAVAAPHCIAGGHTLMFLDR